MPHHTNWEKLNRRLAAEDRTIINVAKMAWRLEDDETKCDGTLASELRQTGKMLDAVTMMVLEVVTYLAGHEKSMTATQFGQRIGVSAATVRRRVGEFKIQTRRGQIPPSELRRAGIGPSSPWPPAAPGTG